MNSKISLRLSGVILEGLILLTVQLSTVHAQPSTAAVHPGAIKIHEHGIRDQVDGLPIDVTYPQIDGEMGFNAAVRRVTDSKVRVFRGNAEPDPRFARHGYLGGTYTAKILDSGIVSVLLDYGIDVPTAVHPWDEMASVNYDTHTHRVLSLSGLFLPNSSYLKQLSRLAISDLEKRDSADPDAIHRGAGPVIRNFQVFTLTETDIVLHFQQHQVAAGAAGAQEVSIPLTKLTPFLRKRWRVGKP